MKGNIKNNIQAENWISDLVGALTDPVICHPQWMEKPPEKIQSAIILQRLIENMAAVKEKRTPLGTDAECSWYLSSASLVAPLSSEWVRIYMYVFNKTCEFMNTAVPEDLIQKELSQYEMALLLKLKRWLYRVRAENRKEKDKIAREDQRERLNQEKISLQPKMFEF